MAQLRRDYDAFVARDVAVLVLGPDDAGAFAAFFAQEELPFVGLPDPEATVLTLFGQEVNLLKLGRMPAAVLVDKQGIVRYVHYGSSMQDTPRHDEILDILDALED